MSSGIWAGGLAIIGVLAGNALDSHTNVQLGAALAVALVVIPGVFWIGAWFRGFKGDLASVSATLETSIALRQKLSDDLAAVHERVSLLEEQNAARHAVIKDKIEQIEQIPAMHERVLLMEERSGLRDKVINEKIDRIEKILCKLPCQSAHPEDCPAVSGS